MHRLVLLLVMFSPAISAACAVCSDGEKQNAMAFFWTTILLTALPLTLLALLIRWAQKRSSAMDTEISESEVSPLEQ
ncbi:MAG: hypothetical protein ACPGQS_04740 [Bradymonadia bacterium]